ncbi:glucose-1-phosphate adenylyltransferase [Orenia marismortui]|uniref:Glucose-1-phosphate adenylyltransferase n=1 Tax=Orenia marismortui TaxID=46469 RepID=A0A4R8GYA1_9FIRM|nr:glucose-1-phosphate adenylyltransferase [Orenia marismortui]TDX51424.1 glucose-1-phosphate adenylyltransferase [Orenia marismortui]
METLALILAGGRGTRLDLLTDHRSKPSVPFAGKFRLIDFALSNCVNSGIYNVGVLTQYLPMSLHDHIGIGKPWDLDRKIGGIKLLQPYTGKDKKYGWYQGTAHAVCQNINYIKESNPKYVIILSGDHVYKMDYSQMIDYHKEKKGELTIAAQAVPLEEANRFGILETDKDMEISNFTEKPDSPPNNLASMGIYVFNTAALIDILEEHCNQENSDFGHHIIPQMIEKAPSYCYEYKGYWRDVGTVKSFWETNLALASTMPELNLYDQNWRIHTRSQEEPPVKFGDSGSAKQSIIANGSIINGEVENSVIASGVFIEEGAKVKDSIIFNNTLIKANATLNKVIVDKNVIIGSNSHIGYSKELASNYDKPNLYKSGLTVIGKGAKIPTKIKIACNSRILPYIKESDFDGEVLIKSGSSVKPKNDKGLHLVDVG